MRKLTFLAAILCVTAFLAAPAAFADSVNLTPSGANTTITIGGTFAAGVPSCNNATCFASPSTNYTIMFTLPTNPNSLGSFVSFPGPNGGFDVTTNLTFDVGGNTMTFNNITVSFTDTLSGDFGGLFFCLDVDQVNCSDPTDTSWNLLGGSLFNNNDANPTLLSGAVSITSGGYFVNGVGPFSFSTPAPTPEPSSLLLFGTGLVGLIGWGRRKFLT